MPHFRSFSGNFNIIYQTNNIYVCPYKYITYIRNEMAFEVHFDQGIVK